MRREGAGLSPGLLGLGLTCNKWKPSTSRSLHGGVCVCQDSSVPSLGLIPCWCSWGPSGCLWRGWEGHPSGLGTENYGLPASVPPVVENRGTEMGCECPGLSQCCFVEREMGVSALAPHPRSPSASFSGRGGRCEPCDSPFQTLPFFLLQQARPPVPPAPCWPPCPCLPGLCSPRWTSSTCSPSTSMAPPRSVSPPTSARYGLGWCGGACS